ncbi:hypothetical protein Egran_01843 [Elaphomyces granulatus]|uniref:Protein kinase domain-containing protein n=1 Tax=Elaphomyces granulatus TaxID=519963 RepID=A0A232M1Z6_9EURO|nr:hypothetical protein Egran_01843 [Elaphomyces granulatus]
MSTIQNLKNFIRHGKQARLVTPHAEPTTDVSAIHVQQQRQPQGKYQAAAGNLDALDTRHGNGQVASQGVPDTQPKVSRADIEQLVAEERQSRSKMPKYPGMERWMLFEKMGDGAFSNVYRARDITGQTDEVAIKVVRKFEMNKNQTDEETHAATDAPPRAALKENVVRSKDVEKALHPLSPFLDQLPPATERRMDFRSPGAVNLREVFDVGYAVHRQEEEGKRRKNVRQGYRGANPPTGFRAGLNALNEDYDDDLDEHLLFNPEPEVDNLASRFPKSSQQAGDVAVMEAKLRTTNLGAQGSSAAQARQAAVGTTRRNQQQGYGQHNAVVATAARQTAARRSRQPFELNMDNATLLGRRERRQKGLEVA